MNDIVRRMAALSPKQRELLELRLKKQEIDVSKIPIIPIRREGGFFQLSFAQARLWFLNQLEGESATYNMPAAVRLSGALNVAALEQTVGEIVRRHETLRTSFNIVDGTPVQVIAPTLTVTLPVVDLQGLPEVEQSALVRRLVTEEQGRPFDLSNGPLLRVTLLRLGSQSHVLLLVIHHIICDGWSIGIFIQELSALYEAFSKGAPSPLPGLPIQYADFAHWQRQWLSGEVLETQLKYWQQQLAKAPPVLELPADRPRPPMQTFRGSIESFELNRDLTRRLLTLSQQSGATLFMTLLAAFAILLSRYSGQEDIVVGSPIANRRSREIEPLIGFFLNTLVLRTDLQGNPTFQELLTRVRQMVLDAYAHQDIPFEQLAEALQPERSLSYSPWFQVMFILQNAPRERLELPGLTLTPFEMEGATAKLDLTLSMSETERGLKGAWEYNTDLFEAATITRMAGHFQTLLEAIVANPQQQISNFPLLSATERHHLLVEWNSTQVENPQDKCIHQLFEAQVELTPDAVAAVFDMQQLTYRQLNCRANQLAHHLQALGVEPDVVVGICIERSLEMLVGLLGILKAGGAYVPLDPAYPQERLKFMLFNSQVSVLLTQEKLVAQLPENSAHLVCLDTDWEVISAKSEENSVSGVIPGNLAYVIYTSGSTGTPKGVMIAHRSLVNAYLAWSDTYQLRARTSSHLQMASFSFDVFSGDLVRALCSGGKLVLCPREWLLAPEKLYRLMREQKVDCAEFVPAVLRSLIRYLKRTELNLNFMQLLIAGSDSWYVKEIEEWKHFCGLETRLINSYGVSEATIDSCYFESAEINLPGDQLVPIGRPFANTQIYILDRNLQPLPIGVAGELHIAGAGLARGYLNHPDLTKEKFIPNPFSDQPGARLYKTGDLARYLPDGNIELLGRIDNQVKIRGFRIELDEIEAAIAQHPEVREAVVIVRSDQLGNKRLVAYVVSNQEQATISTMQQFLLKLLPDYMVPSAFVILEALPLSPNGKVDRRALPTTNVGLSREASFVAPHTPTEEILAAIWAEVLGLEQLGIYDNFFELGGHSLLVAQVISRVRETFSVELPLRSLFESPTVAELSEAIEATRQTESGLQMPAIKPVSRERELPLSFAQARLWFLDQLKGESATYNMSGAVRLSGALDVAALEQAVGKIVRRHEALRTSFRMVDGTPVQVIAPTPSVTLPVVDLQGLPEVEQSVLVQRLATQEQARPFDLANGPLLRVTLLMLGKEEYVLLVTMHHIVSDGWSTGIFIRELSALYEAFCTGAPSPLPDLPVQYADFAVWQRQWLQGEVLESQLAYWKQKLDGVPALLELPTDRVRPTVQTFRGAHQTLALFGELSEGLRTLSRRQGVTLFMTLLTAFQTLLYRYTGQTDICVGTPFANRNRPEVEGLIGFFINTLVLRTDLSGDPSFEDVLSRVREVALGAYAHQDMPFEQLVEAVQPERNLSRNPLFQVMFNLLNFARAPIELPGLTVEPLSPSEELASKFDLTLYASEHNEGIDLKLVYNTELFKPARMVEMLEQFQHLLSQIVEKPQERITGFSLVTPTAQALLPNPAQSLVCEWEGFVLKQFSQQALWVPERKAVVDKQVAWSYAELDALSNQLANYLLTSGIQAQDVVAIYGHRSASLVWALLGVMKAGAAFVILDSDYPASRLFDCLRVATPQGWLQMEAAGDLPEALDEFIATLSPCRLLLPQGVAAARERLKDYSTEVPRVAVDPDDLAYIAFTSGSTGKPKGILGTHRPLSHFLQWHSQTFGLNESDRFSMLSGLSHDPLLRDIFTPLWLGATLCIPDPEGIRTPGWLADWMTQQEISVAHLTPAMGQLLTLTPLEASGKITSLRYAFFSGDILKRRDLVSLQQLAPSVTGINYYGATETPQAMGYFVVPNQEEVGQDDTATSLKAIVPLGRGIKDVQLLVLNSSQQLAGIGEVGEIHIRTPYLAKGYMDDDVLTQERFITNPFRKTTGDRLYKTGDQARYLPDGNIEFLGRIDHQVKIRGFRIELGEIEAMLWQHPAVFQTVVMAREDVLRDKCLVAYLVLKPGPAPTVNDLRRFLQEKLPEYMVPSVFVVLDNLPLTANGKVDYRALPTPNQAGSDLEDAFVAPRNTLELQLAHIWENILDVSPIGVTNNFFDLGGHSLLAVRLIAEIQKQFGRHLPLATFFQAGTIEQMAGILRQQITSSSWSPLVEIQPSGSQRPLFCVHPSGGNVLCYYDLARYLGSDQPLYGLQALGLDGKQDPLTTVEDTAGYYIEALRAVQPQGPYLLAGWSYGGRVAFEMARKLQARGQQVALLALLDSSGLITHKQPLKQPLEEDDAAIIVRLCQEFYYLSLEYPRQLAPDEQLLYVIEQLRQANVITPDFGLTQLRSFLRVYKANRQAARSYVPQHYPGRVTLLRTTERDGEAPEDPTMGWGALAAEGVDLHLVPGTHITMMRKPNVQVLAERLKHCLEQAQADN